MAKKRMITERIDADTSRLYDSLDEVIKYLYEVKEKYPDAYLTEYRYGYEEMAMVFEWVREENAQERYKRVKQEKMIAEQARKDREKAEERKKDMAELDKLKRKLGLR